MREFLPATGVFFFIGSIINGNSPQLAVTSALIPLIASDSSNESLFALDQVDDEKLLQLWHETILQKLKSDDYEGLNSVHLFRYGLTEEDSIPTILASVDDSSREGALREKISELFEEPQRSALRISFEQSSIRRTFGDHLPPICNARNTLFQSSPAHGASIGIRHRLDSTATLGGYVMVDDRPAILTVDHLIPNDLDLDQETAITHLSEQEAIETTPWKMTQNCLLSMQKCGCQPCLKITAEHHRGSNFYESVDLPSQMCAAMGQFRKSKTDLLIDFPVHTFGAMICRSETRSRPSLEHDGKYEAEMDWALFEIDQWPTSLDSHIAEVSKGLEFSKVVPGALVKSTGRTSGHQTGWINKARSYAKHGNRVTEEWSVFKNPESSMKDWIEGGIGVDGDSGAWLIDRETGAVYGMVWGRDRPTTRPICLFSPIRDIVEDIRSMTGALNICLPANELQPSDRKGKAKQECPGPTPPITPHRRGKEVISSQARIEIYSAINAT